MWLAKLYFLPLYFKLFVAYLRFKILSKFNKK